MSVSNFWANAIGYLTLLALTYGLLSAIIFLRQKRYALGGLGLLLLLGLVASMAMSISTLIRGKTVIKIDLPAEPH